MRTACSLFTSRPCSESAFTRSSCSNVIRNLIAGAKPSCQAGLHPAVQIEKLIPGMRGVDLSRLPLITFVLLTRTPKQRLRPALQVCSCPQPYKPASGLTVCASSIHDAFSPFPGPRRPKVSSTSITIRQESGCNIYLGCCFVPAAHTPEASASKHSSKEACCCSHRAGPAGKPVPA